jgi:hypothetical protein
MEPESEQQQTTAVDTPYGDGTLLERIDKTQLQPLFKHDHEHDYRRDGSEETAKYYSESCIHCPMGRLISKT